jgi:hypothetical protein
MDFQQTGARPQYFFLPIFLSYTTKEVDSQSKKMKFIVHDPDGGWIAAYCHLDRSHHNP